MQQKINYADYTYCFYYNTYIFFNSFMNGEAIRETELCYKNQGIYI